MRNNQSKQFGAKKPIYTLRNPHKYMGDADNVIFRSSWERSAFIMCDNNPHILLWGSEEIIIPYLKPVFGVTGQATTKMANYYPDLYVEYVNKAGIVVKELIEIKPKKQTKASRAKKYSTNFFENVAYAVNMAKWAAAKKWCEVRGVKFVILTEDELFK